MSMEYFWDLLFQLMKHGTNTLHVGFIFLSSVHTNAEGVKQYGKCPNRPSGLCTERILMGNEPR